MNESPPKPFLVDDGPAFHQLGLVHRLRRPDRVGPHPAVVMLHGYLGDENVMWTFEQTVPDHWLKIAPRAPLVDGRGYTWHPHHLDAAWPTFEQYVTPVSLVKNLLDALPETYGADPDRIYLMGFSQGAALSYATTVTHPGCAAGIAGLVGFMPEGIEKHLPAAPLLHLPVFIAAGIADKTIPLEKGRHSRDLAEEGGAWVDYHEFDTGHKLDAAGMRALKSWWEALE
jgi:phospholipase/carboxylesterase